MLSFCDRSWQAFWMTVSTLDTSVVNWVLACCVRCWACSAARYSFLSSNSYLPSSGLYCNHFSHGESAENSCRQLSGWQLCVDSRGSVSRSVKGGYGILVVALCGMARYILSSPLSGDFLQSVLREGTHRMPYK